MGDGVDIENFEGPIDDGDDVEGVIDFFGGGEREGYYLVMMMREIGCVLCKYGI